MIVVVGAVPIVSRPFTVPVVVFTSRRPEPFAAVVTGGTTSPPLRTAALPTKVPASGVAVASVPLPPLLQVARKNAPISKILKTRNFPLPLMVVFLDVRPV
jgi:hypothetical protein